MMKRRPLRGGPGAKARVRGAARKPGGAPAAEKRAPDRSAISARGVHLSIQQAAEEFGHDRKTIAKRIRELAIQPDGKRQGYDVFRLRDLLAIERSTEAGKIDPDKLGPFERNAYYKSETERIELGKQIGGLLRREDVEVEWARVLREITLELDTVVDEIERDVGASPLVLEKVEQKLDVMRERMYQGIVKEPAPEGGDAGPVPEPA